MDSSHQGRPPTRRRVLGDASDRVNENETTRRGHQPGAGHNPSSSTKHLPHNESIVPNGTLAVRQEHITPANKHLSTVQAHNGEAHNAKRDSEISNASTNASNNTRRRKTHIGPWQLGRTIGRGGCSRVRLVRHSGTGQFGAAKIISKATAEKVRALSLANLIKSAEHDPSLYPGGKVIPFGLEREICIMKLLDHPNIVRLYDIWENHNELYLIMEYVEGGELFSYIHEQSGLIEIHTVHIFRQIIAALIYCHRINIHHRDLKPENILLDRDTMTVKLVDFGMAALQPIGKKLTTPCGSPHYAAPEVIKTVSYDGAKADVWSCGVILYVLLTGTPPFNYSGENRHLKGLFQDIAAAKYVMPDDLSREAQDLIKRILVADPKRRISLDEIWDHAFLRKYQQELNFVGDNTRLDHWTGPLPAIEEWSELERSTIDREILRYLRTLWHSEKEETIIKRLTSAAPNQEKYFYSALRKYHTDQLENYQPSAHHPVAPSNSDYHHNTRHCPPRKENKEEQSEKHKRSRSGYSILNNEHLHSKHSFYEPSVSEASYDPYRASRQPVVPDLTTLQPNVTIHRGRGSGSRVLRPATAMGHRTGSSLRVQALRNSKRSSVVISHRSSNRSTQSHRTASTKRCSMSRSSLVSSHFPSSPPVTVRSGGLGRRGVSFSHLRDRRSSALTASTLETNNMNASESSSLRPHTSIGSHESSIRSDRLRQPSGFRKRIRRGTRTEVPRLRLRRPESPTKYIQGEARKVSLELGKVMEEAFNRSSVGSSIRTTATGTELYRDRLQHDSPPTSCSNTRDSGGSTLATPNTKSMLEKRPLPPIPTETPNTFLQRKLAETRADIARRLLEDEDNAEHFNEVIEHLDRLMRPSVSGQRAVSAPVKSPENHTSLRIIQEERRSGGIESRGPGYRAVTDPVRPQGHVDATEQSTIRIVDDIDASVAPLTIRKQSSQGMAAKPANIGPSVPWPGLIANPVSESVQEVHKDPPTITKETGVIKKKRSLWFRRTAEEKEQKQEKSSAQLKKKQSVLEISKAWQGSDDRIKSDPSQVKKNVDVTKHDTKQSRGSIESEFPTRNSNPPATKGDGALRKGLFGLFNKRAKEDKGPRSMELGGLNFSSSSILSTFDISLEKNPAASRANPPEVQMNWLSRFLHIKPVSQAMCFKIGRGKVRQEIVHLLRLWQRWGVRDVSFDRATNIITARVDKINHLKIKPVSFIIELFVVLEHGRRANLCLARFTQTRGAASSFRHVFDILEDVFKSRLMLVDDEEKKLSMMEVLG